MEVLNLICGVGFPWHNKPYYIQLIKVRNSIFRCLTCLVSKYIGTWVHTSTASPSAVIIGGKTVQPKLLHVCHLWWCCFWMHCAPAWCLLFVFSLEVRLCEGNACVCLRCRCGFLFHLQVHYPDAWQNCLLWCLWVFVWVSCLCASVCVSFGWLLCYCYWLRCSGFCLCTFVAVFAWVQKWLCKSCLVKRL